MAKSIAKKCYSLRGRKHVSLPFKTWGHMINKLAGDGVRLNFSNSN